MERGLSQECLAELADLDRTTPSLLERGLRQPTSALLSCSAGRWRSIRASWLGA
jgi:DNA-binding XRE family transcriptional regulator